MYDSFYKKTLLLKHLLSIIKSNSGGVFLKVLFVCSECSPFVKTGGLADVASSLPTTLSTSISCSVVIPYYKCIKEKNIANYIGHTYFKFGSDEVYCGIFKTKLNNVNYFFIDNNDFFNHEKLYGINDDVRFTFFNIAVIESLSLLGDYDIFHLNDWHTGLIPFLLKYKYKLDVKTVFTIHNIQYQGIFDKSICKLFNVYNNTLEFDNMINFMKCGITNSDIVTTVSSTYRDETLTYQYSYYLENILLDRKDDYYGIVNGIDTTIFDPNNDKYIYYKYNDINGKSINKRMFCKTYNLNDNMLCSIITRLCDQKGIELLIDSIDFLMNTTNINLFLMGSGDKNYEDKFIYYSLLYPHRIKVYIGYSESLAQQVYASSDLLFVPSKFEPCGLSQLIAMRYGTLPLVRETGGLKDTVIPYNSNDNSGCGFSFRDFNTSSFNEVFNIAYATYKRKEVWNTLVCNAMKKDFSFEKSAGEYLKLYNKRG